ncbi:MAG: GerMN domain-containing protein, partial [Sediminispirochaetaceae bacterium]
GVELSALEALLKGPLPEEEEKDYFSAIPEGVEIEDFEVQGGEAYVSFSAKIEKNVAGSAWVQGIRDQIGLTLRQFEHIERVEIAVEGQTEGILQP